MNDIDCYLIPIIYQDKYQDFCRCTDLEPAKLPIEPATHDLYPLNQEETISVVTVATTVGLDEPSEEADRMMTQQNIADHSG